MIFFEDHFWFDMFCGELGTGQHFVAYIMDEV